MDENFLKDLSVPFNTPDLCQLEDQENHLLLDCRVKRTDTVLCSAYTVERMSLFIRQVDYLPIPVKMRSMPKARIGGTLYKTTTEGLIELDKIKQNRLSFERKQVEVYIPSLDPKKYGQFRKAPVPVWFYEAIPDVWEGSIERSQSRYNVSPRNPELILAKRFVDNSSLLNNHYRISPKRVEEFFDKPKPTIATQAVIDYVKRKNAEAIKRLPSWKNKANDKVAEYFEKKALKEREERDLEALEAQRWYQARCPK